MFEDLRERDIGHKGEVAEPPPPPPPPAMAGGQMSRDDDLEAPLMEEEADALRHPPVLENAPPSRERDTLLYVCAVLSIVTAVGALLCMVVNLISLLRSFDYRGFDYRVSVCADFTLFLFLFLSSRNKQTNYAYFVGREIRYSEETEARFIFTLWLLTLASGQSLLHVSLLEE